MDLVTLDWSTAEVKKSTLAVALEGDIPKGWRRSFQTTVRLLGSGEWGEVQVKKNKVQVSDVEPGTEESSATISRPWSRRPTPTTSLEELRRRRCPGRGRSRARGRRRGRRSGRRDDPALSLLLTL